MAIGGTRYFGNLTPTHWQRMTQELNTGAKLIHSLASELYEQFLKALERTHEAMTNKYCELAVFRRINGQLTLSHSRLKKRLLG